MIASQHYAFQDAGWKVKRWRSPSGARNQSEIENAGAGTEHRMSTQTELAPLVIVRGRRDREIDFGQRIWNCRHMPSIHVLQRARATEASGML